jgi:hypothetical protein
MGHGVSSEQVQGGISACKDLGEKPRGLLASSLRIEGLNGAELVPQEIGDDAIVSGVLRDVDRRADMTHHLRRHIGEIKRHTDVAGIFPNDEASVRLVGALLLEQSDDWAVQPARDMTLETIAPMGGAPVIGWPDLAP